MKGISSLLLLAVIAIIGYYVVTVKDLGKEIANQSKKTNQLVSAEKSPVSTSQQKQPIVSPKSQDPVAESAVGVPSDFPFFVNKNKFTRTQQGGNTVMTLSIGSVDSPRVDNYLNYTLPQNGWVSSVQADHTTKTLEFQKESKRVQIQVVYDQNISQYTMMSCIFLSL